MKIRQHLVEHLVACGLWKGEASNVVETLPSATLDILDKPVSGYRQSAIDNTELIAEATAVDYLREHSPEHFALAIGTLRCPRSEPND
jgi:hypothetical protein